MLKERLERITVIFHVLLFCNLSIKSFCCIGTLTKRNGAVNSLLNDDYQYSLLKYKPKNRKEPQNFADALSLIITYIFEYKRKDIEFNLPHILFQGDSVTEQGFLGYLCSLDRSLGVNIIILCLGRAAASSGSARSTTALASLRARLCSPSTPTESATPRTERKKSVKKDPKCFIL